MPINMACPSCGKTLAAPDTAAGKRAKCPGCGQIMIVPAGARDAETFGVASPQPQSPLEPQPSDPQPVGGGGENSLDGLNAPEQSPGAAGGDGRRPCPECGEMIVAGAAKCRFCGAVFDPRLRGSSAHRGQSYQGFAITSMVLGILALPTACFGIVFGIVAIVFAAIAKSGMTKSNNYEGKGMATAGMFMGILGAVGWTVLYLIIFLVVGLGTNRNF